VRGRQLVWSDPKIAELSRNFVTVADEVYKLYPEDKWNLERVKDRPEHKFFKRFGEAMPAGDWNHPGTKQGLYMIGPDAEYLEGRFAASGFPDDIVERMERALVRWEKLRREKRYANKPVPKVVTTLPSRLENAEFVLRVHSRDLPRGAGEQCRFDKDRHVDAGWMEFTKWAWNENWQAVEDWRALVPGRSSKPQDVDAAFVQRLAREMLIDNVRGQAAKWKPEHVRRASLTMRRGPGQKGMTTVVYEGEVAMRDGERAIEARLYGQGLYDARRRDLVKFELVALGTRTGAHRFNQRDGDAGPAPIGFAITRYRKPEAKPQPQRAAPRRQGRKQATVAPAKVRRRTPGPTLSLCPGAEWPRARPGASGLDSAPMRRLFDRIGDGDYGPVDRVLVVQTGRVVYDQRWQHDYTELGRGVKNGVGWGVDAAADERVPPDYNYLDATRHPFRAGTELHSLQSATKSVASILIGIAIQKGLLDGVAQPVLPLLERHAPKNRDVRLTKVTLEDVLTMRSGIEWHEHDRPLNHTNTTLQLECSDHWLQFVLRQPFDAEPGTKWVYSSGGSHLLSGILREATGLHVDTFAEQELFEPLGIRSHHWKKDPQGHPDCEGGLYLRAEDLARIGQLMLLDGCWGDQRLLPEGWVAASTKRHVDMNGRGYGYQWWRADRDGHVVYAGLGFGGQHLIVVPDLSLVCVAFGWNVFGQKTRWIERDLVQALIDTAAG